MEEYIKNLMNNYENITENDIQTIKNYIVKLGIELYGIDEYEILSYKDFSEISLKYYSRDMNKVSQFILLCSLYRIYNNKLENDK